MFLYLISQSVHGDYDTYDSAVVAAKSKKAARQITPASSWDSSSWCNSPDQVEVKLIGKASREVKEGVICASFNAG